MKTHSWFVSVLLVLTLRAAAQEPKAPAPADGTVIESAPPTIVARGPHHRVWERAEVRTLPNGRSITNRTSFTELEVGLCRQENGEWIEGSETVELFQGAAIGRKAQYQVIWAANANSPAAIDLLTADQKRLRSHVIGLGVFDPDTGNSELLADIKDSIGELHPPNQVLYRDAFDGILADLRYAYRKGGFVQDVVVREKVSLPAGYGPASRLEIWTEFLDSPVPLKTVQSRGGLTDESLDFGAMQMSAGNAFALGEANAKSAPVAKRWLQIEGRTFLVEAVRFSAVAAELNRLPERQQAAVRQPKAGLMAKADANRRPFPAPRRAKVKDPKEKIQMAALPPPNRGLVVDYDLSGSITNLILSSDTNWYIGGPVTLLNPTFEAGVVIKMAPTNGARILISNPSAGFTWLATAYRPVVITARDDHSVGAAIGTNALSGYYASSGLRFGSGAAVTLEHLRVSHAIVGVSVDESDLTNRHSQFVHCGDAIESHYGQVTLENVLIYQATNAFAGEMTAGVYKVTGRHLTIDQATNLASYYDTDMNFTNSLLVNVTISDLNLHTNAVIQTTDNNIFQMSGAGAHYLATNSPYRNAGVTNIGARLLADLKQRTTYPPIIYANRIDANLTLFPQAQRDADFPDLGYSYPPLDYLLKFNVVTNNAVVTLAAGVSVGWGNHGAFWLQDGCSLISEGTPVLRVQFSRFNAVQEIGTNWGGTVPSVQAFNAYHLSPSDPSSIVRLRFTDFNGLSGQSHDLYADNYIWKINPLIVEHCTFNAAPLFYYGDSTNLVCTLFNNVFERVILDFEGDVALTLHNNFFRGPAMAVFDKMGESTWTIRDNLFADTAIWDGTESGPDIVHDHNGYLNVSDRLYPNQASDVVLTNLAFQIGPLGRFYQPTNSALTNAGSRLASAAGLYHFTTATNQVKETNSPVDIGYHYVAVNGAGQPIDTDGDGLADYFEDTDGDGTVDSGETDWQSYNSFFGLSGTPGLQVFTPLK